MAHPLWRRRSWLVIALLAVICLAAWQLGPAAWGQYHRRAMEDAIARRDFARAEAELACCLLVWPQRAELHLQAARLARRQGDRDEALRQLRFCRADSQLAPLVGLEESLLAIQSGNFAGSSQLDEYARQNRQSPEALLIDEAQIKGSLAALDIPRARAYLAQWMEQRTAPADQAQGHVWRGAACVLAGEAAESQEHFRAALELDPQHRAARLSLAQVLAEPDPAESAVHLELLRAEHPDDAEVLYHLAVAERNLGRLDDAAATLDELLNHAPEHMDALVLQARIALDRQDLAAAEKWLSRAQTLEPKHRAVLLAMVEYLRLAGRPEEAAGYQQRMAEIEAEVRQHVETALEQRAAARNAQTPAEGAANP